MTSLFRNEPIRYISILRNWLTTYPPFEPFMDSRQDNFNDKNIIFIGEFPSSVSQGTSLIQPTQLRTIKKENIVGGIVRTRSFQTMLFARVDGNDTFNHEDATNFNTDFLHWAEEQQDYGDTPKFGNIDKQFEKIEVTGNFRWQQLAENRAIAEYMWQVNIVHKWKTI